MVSRRSVVLLTLVTALGLGSLAGQVGDAPLSYGLLGTDPPHDAPSVVLCRGQLFAASNSSAIQRIDLHHMRVREVKEYPELGVMHQITTDGNMLYAAYFTQPCELAVSGCGCGTTTCTCQTMKTSCSGPPKHGIVKIDPADLEVVADLPLEEHGVVGWPEGFVWHDGYLYEAAYGFRGGAVGRIVKVEPVSMTYVNSLALPEGEGTHGIAYDGSHLYALGVPPESSTAQPDTYYKIDPATLEIQATLKLPEGLHHYGGNVYVPAAGAIYTSPGWPAETYGALVKIDTLTFSIASVLRGGGRHWLATDARNLYLLEGDVVRVIDPVTMSTAGRSAPPFERGVSTLHYGYVAEDGMLYLGFENVGGRAIVGRMHSIGPRDRTKPGAPVEVRATAAEGIVRLEWSGAEDAESNILYYRIYRSLPGDPPESLVVVPGASRSFTDRSAAPGKQYAYEIAAINGSGLEGPTSTAENVVNTSAQVRLGTTFSLMLPTSALPDEAQVSATFTSPSGGKHVVSGAYDGPGRWRVRFSPSEDGAWRYAVASTDPAMVRFGAFEVKPGSDRRGLH